MRCASAVKRERLLSPASRRPRRYMRDGVLEGTGRLLRNHPMRIAGKTGTAEVVGEDVALVVRGLRAVRRASAARRIAFAVIVENAGYGGAAAASAAATRNRRRLGRAALSRGGPFRVALPL
jgi:cell division protein FtsI/penicillin-binding protein 2